MSDEDVLESYMETGKISDETISGLVYDRKIFPCYFGSALKLEGVEELLEGMERFTFMPVYRRQFGAKVFKIAKDSKGNRLTYMKITGGALNVKEVLHGSSSGKD